MVAPLLVAGALGLAKEFAPSLVRHFAGDKAGDVAESVLGIAGDLTGAGTPDAMAEAIRADPAAALEFQGRLADLDFQIEQAYLADRQDARARDEKIRAGGGRNLRADLLIAGDVLGLLICILAIYYLPADTPGEIRGILSMVAGYFGLGLRDAHQFEFGSSRGSKDKDGLMAGLKMGENGK